MKTTIIYETKKITIDEIINNNCINLGWICILVLNLIINYYLEWCVKKINIDYSLISEINKKFIEILLEKFIFSRKIIYVGLLLNLFYMCLKKKIQQIIPDSVQNYSEYLDFSKFIPIYLYLFSSLVYKPFITNTFDENYHNLLLIISGVFYYLFESFSLVLFIINLIVSIIFLCDYVLEKIKQFYKLQIKDIVYEYTDSKIVEIDKIV